MLIRIGHDIEWALDSPTTLIAALSVHPSRAQDLLRSEKLVVEPPLVPRTFRDEFDNIKTRLEVPAGVARLRLRSHAVVRDSGLPDPVWASAQASPLGELPTQTLGFLLPSRYGEVDSELMSLAWQRFGHVPAGWARVQAVCDYVHGHLRFDYAQARANRTALDAWREGVGVCRDFAHLALTLCRCLNMPARYVTGYLGDIGIAPVPSPMDFSAWFEVWLDCRWHTFDARHNTPRIGRVAMARGCDAADVPIAMSFGRCVPLRFEVVAEEYVAALAGSAVLAGAAAAARAPSAHALSGTAT